MEVQKAAVGVLEELFRACVTERDRAAALALMDDGFIFSGPSAGASFGGEGSAGTLFEWFSADAAPRDVMLEDIRTKLTGGVVLASFRLVFSGGGSPVDICAAVRVLGVAPRVSMVHLSAQADDRVRRAERALEEEKRRLVFALRKAGVSCWEYDISTDSACFIVGTELEMDSSPVLNPSEYYVQEEDIHPESEEALRGLYRDIRSGEKEGEAEIQMLTEDGSGWTTRRISFSTIFEDGKPTGALCVEKNIDGFFYASASYERVLEQYNALERECLFSWRINLTAMEIEYSNHRKGYTCPFVTADDFREERVHAQSLHLPEEQRAMFQDFFSLKRLKLDFAYGKRESAIEFQWQRSNGEMQWLHASACVVGDPGSNQLMAFMYIRDISERKFWQSALNAGRKMTCDFIAVIDTVTGAVRRITEGEKCIYPPDSVPQDYERAIRRFADSCVLQPERAAVLSRMSIDSIIENLKDREEYSFSCSVSDASGAPVPKIWVFRYMDNEKRNIIYIRRSRHSAV